MGKVRRCDSRCHTAKGDRCKCWCGGFFHGTRGLANREALRENTEQKLKAHGFKKGKTAYIETPNLPGMGQPSGESSGAGASSAGRAGGT